VGRRNAGQWRIASAQRIGRRSVLEQAEVDLSKLDTLEAVVANGRLYPREDLDAGLERYRQRYSSPSYQWVMMTLMRFVAPHPKSGTSKSG